MRLLSILPFFLIALFLTIKPVGASSLLSFSDLLARPRPHADARIAYGATTDQFGELWLPKQVGPYPVVVMFHGGCWQARLPGVELMAYIADDLRRIGIAVWSVEYRRLGSEGGGYPGMFLDAGQGVDYLRSLAPTYHLDLSRVVFLGHSAGGTMALWAAGRHRLPVDSPLRTQNPLPALAVVTLSGINDLSEFRESGPGVCGEPETIDEVTGYAARKGKDIYADTSPAALLPLNIEQLIVSGTLDSIVPNHFAEAYAVKARRSGDEVKLLNVDNAGHFELIDPSSKAWAEIKNYLIRLLKI